MSFASTTGKTANKARVPILVFLIMLVTVGAVFAIVAFTQTGPSTTIPPPTAVMAPACSTLANFTKPVPVTGSVAYSCTGLPNAFTVTNGPVTATPTVHGLPSSLTLTFYNGAQNLSPCPGSAPSATILNNTAMSIATGTYNYCIFYTGLATGLTFSFSISWA